MLYDTTRKRIDQAWMGHVDSIDTQMSQDLSSEIWIDLELPLFRGIARAISSPTADELSNTMLSDD